MDEADLPGSEGQPTEEPTSTETPNGSGAPSLEDQLKEFDGQQNDGSSFLDSLNSLGIMRNGLPVEFNAESDVKELISKGYDYTQKTMELANQKNEMEQAFAAREKELMEREENLTSHGEEVENKLLENQVMGMVLTELQNNDPDIFNELVQAFNQKMGMFTMQNPATQGLRNELLEIKKQLAESQKQSELKDGQEVSKEWENGISQVQSEYGLKFKKLGIKPNWEKVKSTWASDQSGTQTVQQALFAVHGADITKALEAQSKLNATAAKSAQRRGTATAQAQQPVKKEYTSGSYMQDLERIAAKHGA